MGEVGVGPLPAAANPAEGGRPGDFEAMPLSAPVPPRPTSYDPESTAAWSIHDEDREEDAPAAMQQQSAEGAKPGWSGETRFELAPQPGGIVPDDWFVDASQVERQPDGATAQFNQMDASAGGDFGGHHGGFGPQQGGFGPQQGGFGQEQGGFGPQHGGFGGPQNGPGPTGAEPWENQQYGMGQGQHEAWHEGPQSNATALMSTQGGPGYGAGPGYPQPEYGQGYPPPGGPYDEYGQSPHKDGKSNRTLLLVVGGLVAIALLAVGYVTFSGGGGSGGPSSPVADKSSKGSQGGDPHDQASAVNAILDDSLKSREQLNGAIGQAEKCNGLDGAISVMQQVQTDRQSQIDKTKALNVDKLDNGPQLRDALNKAISVSLDVDKAYLSWAQASKGCHGHTKANDDVRHGQELSTDATNAKKDFAKLWDPVAEKEGFNKRGTYF